MNAMKVTYVKLKMKCGTCKRTYYAWWPKDEKDNPPCTLCHPPEPWEITGAPSIGTNRMRALKVAEQEMLSRGFTDMKDNLRPGETAIKLTPRQSQMADDAAALGKAMQGQGDLSKVQQNLMEKFWGGTGRPGNPIGLPNSGQMLAQAKSGAAAAKAEGWNPVQRIQNHVKSTPLAPGTRRRYA